jgi:O-acetyl-ADP-ribose deacetylase (regulator of RNase III)
VAQIGESSITVVLGRLEQSITDPSQVLVVLPANEYFNDRCINDPRSALGAFVQTKFPGKTREFESLVHFALREKPSRTDLVGGKTLEAYGLGTTVFMDRPLNETHRILLAAATTERQGEGLRGDVTALFTIVREANRVAKENRLSEVVLPMIGAGHGSICPDHALIVQLLAWSELIYSHPGQKLAVRIVIFRADATAKPEVGLKSIARLMAVATASCAPCPQE